MEASTHCEALLRESGPRDCDPSVSPSKTVSEDLSLVSSHTLDLHSFAVLLRTLWSHSLCKAKS